MESWRDGRTTRTQRLCLLPMALNLLGTCPQSPSVTSRCMCGIEYRDQESSSRFLIPWQSASRWNSRLERCLPGRLVAQGVWPQATELSSHWSFMAAPCCPSWCLVSLQFSLETMFLGAGKTPGTLYSLVPLLRCALDLQDRLPSPTLLCYIGARPASVWLSPVAFLLGIAAGASGCAMSLRAFLGCGFALGLLCLQSVWPLTLGGLPRASCCGGQTSQVLSDPSLGWSLALRRHRGRGPHMSSGNR